MKPNVNENKTGLAQKGLLLVGAATIIAAAFAAGAYSNAVRQSESFEPNDAVMSRLLDARRSNLIIQCLNRGHEAEAKQYLQVSFADDVHAAERLVEGATPGAVAEFKVALALLARDEKAHPEFYAIAKPAAPSSPSMQIARHLAKP
jgi:hypothetical protein